MSSSVCTELEPVGSESQPYLFASDELEFGEIRTPYSRVSLQPGVAADAVTHAMP